MPTCHAKRWAICAIILALIGLIAVFVLPGQSSYGQVFKFAEGTFHPFVARPLCFPVPSFSGLSPARPGWHIAASTLFDVTGDQMPEWVLIVWRPWRDWPIQRWSAPASPIAAFHDAAGDSCHLILLDPDDGHEIWAGSALPAPLLGLAAGDVDGDGLNEVVALEGDYATGRAGPAAFVDVWGWNGFGFTLEWRSPQGSFSQLCLTQADDDGILDIAIR